MLKAGGTLRHKELPSHKLHIIYYNFPEIGRLNSKVTKSACEKLNKLYDEEIIDYEDSLIIIINDTISESLENSFNLMNVKLQSELKEKGINEDLIDEMKKNNYPLKNSHFRNIHLFNINNLTNNVLEHRLVPKHNAIRKNKDNRQIEILYTDLASNDFSTLFKTMQGMQGDPNLSFQNFFYVFRLYARVLSNSVINMNKVKFFLFVM